MVFELLFYCVTVVTVQPKNMSRNKLKRTTILSNLEQTQPDLEYANGEFNSRRKRCPLYRTLLASSDTIFVKEFQYSKSVFVL